MTFPPFLSIVLAGGLAGLTVLCTSCRQSPPAAGGTVPATPVMTGQPEERLLTEWKEASGRLEATESVEIRPRITGHLDKVSFESGQLVKKGDVLFVIDPRWHQAALASAEAQRVRAHVMLENAEREWARNSRLEKASAISASEADTQRTRVSEARAAVQVAEAARDSAVLDLQMTEVRSPIDGRVSRPLLTEGSYVSGVAGFTTLLTTVVSIDPIFVYVSVDEATYLAFARMLREKKITLNAEGKIPAEVQMTGETGWPHQGWVESFDNRIDPATGSIVVRAVLPNPDRTLVPGAFARVRVPASLEYKALLVDEKVIGTDQNQKFVLTLGAGNVAQYRPVSLGENLDGKRIIRHGLQPGDTLIVSNLQLIRPGMPVTPLPPAPAAAKTAQR